MKVSQCNKLRAWELTGGWLDHTHGVAEGIAEGRGRRKGERKMSSENLDLTPAPATF
jgi:hypothetical protein